MRSDYVPTEYAKRITETSQRETRERLEAMTPEERAEFDRVSKIGMRAMLAQSPRTEAGATPGE